MSPAFTKMFYVRGLVDKYSYQLYDQLLNEQMWSMTENPNLTDVQLTVSGTVFRANKAIICAHSNVFRAMFESGMVETTTGSVVIDDIPAETFRDFLRFVYTGSLDASRYNNVELARCADKYWSPLYFNCAKVFVQCNSEKVDHSSRNSYPEVENVVKFGRQ